MRKLTTVLFFFLALTLSAYGQEKTISGIWEGNLNAGVTLRIVFHFNQNGDQGYSGTMDSPDQNVKGIPCSSITLRADSVTAEVQVIKGVFRAVLVNDSTLSGVWAQGPGVFPLVLNRVAAVEQLIRPQTPHPPYPYNSEDVSYDNADHTIHFGATFTYPKTPGPFPTAILITGSGQQDRDETIFEHKPFAVIADYLTKKGYGILRVDDRGMGQTTGDVLSATSMDFAGDVEAGIQYLKTRKEVDKNKIGLIGHSEGGLIGAIVASRSKNIHFLILLAGPGVPGAEILLEQQTDPLKTAGVSPEVYQAYHQLAKNTLGVISGSLGQPDSLVAQKIEQVYTDWKVSIPDSIRIALHAETATPTQYLKQIRVELSPWFRFFIATDPGTYLSRVSCPVLALDGSRDIQVDAAKNIPAIAAALRKGNNQAVTTKIFPGLNHLFQLCHTCTLQEYGQLEETFDPEVLQTMAVWLDQHVRNKALTK